MPEKIKARINQLVEKGEEVLATRSNNWFSVGLFHQWKAEALSFLNNVFGSDSTHFQGFQQDCKKEEYPDPLRGQGILKAAKEDIDGGYLIKLENLVAADIFTDFLEMSEHLIEQGYKDPAASLVGAVLEDGLRKITKNNGIKLKSKEDIGSLNKKLADGQIYNRLIQSKIQFWKKIRDAAAHGNFSEYDLSSVKEMLSGVRDFLEQHLEK